MPTQEDEDEWEYEYDPEELEAFYVPVDFTTFTPPPLSSKRATINSRTLKVVRESAAVSIEAEQALNHPATTSSNANTPAEIQILDIHSTNPIIAYEKKLFSCHWATDVGTAIFLAPAAPSRDVADHQAPLRSYPSFDLIAKSRARLVAVPAQMKPREQEELAIPHIADDDLREDPIRTAHGDVISIAKDGRMRIEVPANSTAQKKDQARFLERWSKLRSQSGRDPMKEMVPLNTVKRYEPPEGWEEERREWLEKGRQEMEALGAGVEGLRKRRRRMKRTRREREASPAVDLEEDAGSAAEEERADKRPRNDAA